MTASEFARVCDEDELWDGEMAAFRIAGGDVLVVRIDGCYRAYQDSCPHQHMPLTDGTLTGTTLTCRHHMWQFDVRTGRGINPAAARLARHPVAVEAGGVWVQTTPSRDEAP